MSLFNNPNWIGFDGQPITGRVPPVARVTSGTPGVELTPQQRGQVQRAFKLFCDAVAASAIPDGFHVQHRDYPDGMKVRMESNDGKQRVFVAFVGGEEKVFFGLLASPRAFGTTFQDGDPSHRPVYLYSVPKGQKPRQKKARVFTQTPEYPNLREQPGTRFWHDTREDKQTTSVVSWWGQVHTGGTELNAPSNDRVSMLGGTRTWFLEWTNFKVYVDHKLLGTLHGTLSNERILCAALHAGPSGIKLRAATTGVTSSPMGFQNVVKLYELTPADIETSAAYTVRQFVTENKPVIGNFNASATKLCFLDYDASAGYALSVGEMDFEAGTIMHTHHGAKDVISQDFVLPPTRHTLENFINNTDNTIDDGTNGVRTWAGDIDKSLTLKKHFSVMYHVPVACAYDQDQLVVLEVRDYVDDRYDMGYSLVGSYTMVHSWVKTSETYDGMGGVYRTYDNTYEAAVNATLHRTDVRQVDRLTRYVKIVGATETVLFETASNRALDWTRTMDSVTDYGVNTVTTTGDTSISTTFPQSNYNNSTHHDVGGFNTAAVMFRTCLVAWEPERDYCAVLVTSASLGWSSAGRYQQKLRLVETKGGVTVGDNERIVTADGVDFGYVWAPSGAVPKEEWPLHPSVWTWGETTDLADSSIGAGPYNLRHALLYLDGPYVIRYAMDYSGINSSPITSAVLTFRDEGFLTYGSNSWGSAVPPDRRDMVFFTGVFTPDDGKTSAPEYHSYNFWWPAWFPGADTDKYRTDQNHGMTLCHCIGGVRAYEAKSAVGQALTPTQLATFPNPTDTQARLWLDAPIFLPKDMQP